MNGTRLHALSLGGAVAITAMLGLLFAILATLSGVTDAVVILIGAIFVMSTAYYSIYEHFNGDSTTEEDPSTQATPESEPTDALETLRRRYARDEISEADFERKLESLLETETVADAERHVRENTESADNHELERSFE